MQDRADLNPEDIHSCHTEKTEVLFQCLINKRADFYYKLRSSS